MACKALTWELINH